MNQTRDSRTSPNLGPTPKIYDSAEKAFDAKFYAAKDYFKKVDMEKFSKPRIVTQQIY